MIVKKNYVLTSYLKKCATVLTWGCVEWMVDEVGYESSKAPVVAGILKANKVFL